MKIISNQHQELLTQCLSSKFSVVLLMGGRSTGKSTDACWCAIFALRQNLDTVIVKKKKYAIMIMRQNAGSIKHSIWKTFTNTFSLSKPLFGEIDKYCELQETAVKLKILDKKLKDVNVGELVGIKGFQSSNKSNTASLKGLEKVNLYLIDEAEEIRKHDYQQLKMTAIREGATIVLICNTPHKDHWIVKEFLDLLPTKWEGFFDFQAKRVKNFTLIRSKISQNEFLSHEAYQNYLATGVKASGQYNLEAYLKDIKGFVNSNIIGKVFTNYLVCSNEEFDSVNVSSNWGMDFGFSNDPTTIVQTKKHNGCLYVKEWLYQTNLTIPQTDKKMLDLKISKQVKIYADGGGLGVMLIAQLKQLGWNIVPAVKGAGSVKSGILTIKDYQVRITQNSQNILEEFNNYTYKLDNNKEATTEPIDGYNHAIDAIRYCLAHREFKILTKEEIQTKMEEAKNQMLQAQKQFNKNL